MTFIQSFREAHNLELNEFARVVNTYRKLKLKQADEKAELCGLISAELVHMLEVDKHCVTHPQLADAIATVCGATAKQRDRIVHEKHRGQWTLNQDDMPMVMAAIQVEMNKQPPKEMPKPHAVHCARSIVKIDFYGNVLATYQTLKQTARQERMSEKTIRRMCKRKRPGVVNPFTFRYADEWYKMSNAEKIADAKKWAIWDVAVSSTPR